MTMRSIQSRLALLGVASVALSASAMAQSPTAKKSATAKPVKQKPPALGTPKAFKLPPAREFSLANGMKVTLVPFGKIPKVSVYTSVRTGNIDESANQVWLADVTGDMMREGTTTRSSTDIAEQVAGMGGDLTVNVASDNVRVGGAVLSENGPEMIRLVADVLRNPKFPESELARVKDTKAREMAIAKSTPQTIAEEQFVKTLYGDHPYGRTFPTEAMLKGYTIQQVKDFHAKNFGAARAHLYIVGVYDASAVEQAARAAFGDWKAGPAPTNNPPSPKASRSVALLDRPDAVQSTLMLGLPTPNPTARDYTALEVTDALLGGTFGSRITTNIREQKGYTYSPYSYLATHRHDAYWVQQADVTTKFTGASLKEILGEIERLRTAPPPQSELAGIKNNMIGIFTLRNASRGGIVYQLDNVDLQGLPSNYLSTYVQRVMAVTPADVERVTRAYLRPEAMTLVVVGDKKTVEAQIAPYQKPVQ
jgi:predicted Zn-dependent peptidase